MKGKIKINKKLFFTFIFLFGIKNIFSMPENVCTLNGNKILIITDPRMFEDTKINICGYITLESFNKHRNTKINPLIININENESLKLKRITLVIKKKNLIMNELSLIKLNKKSIIYLLQEKYYFKICGPKTITYDDINDLIYENN